MSLRLGRLWLILGLLLAGETYALGLGNITLDSALNEPLRARIELVSATPEDLAELRVGLASAETFERYGIYRPLYLTRLEFTVVPSGRAGGNVIQVRSQAPITEPFVTFLVEASWPRGRLLREYTVLLDPPTFAPQPGSQAAGAVTAPTRAAPADSGRIERSAPAERPAPARAANEPFDTTAGSEVRVQRGDTLWHIAESVRPDARLSMNQTMLAIYEANPQAFDGNINRLNAGAVLRVPSADDIFRISRGDAASEVQRQNAAFGGGSAAPRLTLVPPDSAPGDRAGSTGGGAAADSGRNAAARIQELERTIAEQQSLIEVRDDELARLRDELARVREQAATAADAAPAADVATPDAVPGAEPVEPPAAVADSDRVFADDSAAAPEEPPAAEAPAEAAPSTAPARTQPARATEPEPGLVDRILGVLTGFWGLLGLGLLLVLGVLVWLAKRAASAGSEEESTGVWDALDAEEEVDSESLASTERLRALARDDDSSIVVVEQEHAAEQRGRAEAAPETRDSTAETGRQPTLEDTFSSETAINLDQSDPIAEADFHMAYGLYDQAADLVNGALAVEPERQDLMAKLCEIYFVWGNRDSFVDAASRLHDQLGGESSPDWDKIVIMGRQIAGDHKLFAGASAGSATRAVDLTLDDEEGGALDMDFAGGPDGPVSDIVDLSGGEDEATEQSGIDFLFDEELDTGASTTREMPSRDDLDATVESPTVQAEAAQEESTVESPTLEQPASEASAHRDTPTDATAEIDLDDLGLDLDDLTAAGLGLDDDGAGGTYADLDATAESGVLAANDDEDETGRNPSLDDSLSAIGELSSPDDAVGGNDATGTNAALVDDEHADTDVDFESSLLDATGHTQVLPEDTLSDDDRTMLAPLGNDDDKTMLAPFGDEDGEDEYAATAALSRDDVDLDLDLDRDFAKTEALPKSAFDGDETGQMPKLPGESTDLDLDLDDLTAALRISDGDTVDQPRDDATVERPRLKAGDGVDLDLGDLGDFLDETPTEALSPEDFSDELHEARTMTEVGTKLDLARAYVDMGDPEGARSILEEVLEEGDDGQRQQAQKLIETLPA